jgi:hypothetical protein
MDAFLIPFSMVWCGFAIFWETAAARSDVPFFVLIWGGLFVAIGVYVVVGRFLVRAISLRRTRYVVTDRRLVVTNGLRGRRTESHYLDSLPPPMIRERDDRSGTLSFGRSTGISDLYSRRSTGSSWRSWSDVPSSLPVLVEIPEVRYVRDIVANAQAKPR